MDNIIECCATCKYRKQYEEPMVRRVEGGGAMSELLPCPFCGADHTQLYVAKIYDCVKIGCLSCSAQFLLANHFGNNKEAVVSAWNTRAEIQRIEELEQLCRDLWELGMQSCDVRPNATGLNFEKRMDALGLVEVDK